jgi:hypothetical protein
MDKDLQVKQAAQQLSGFFRRVTIHKDKDDQACTVATFEDPQGGLYVKLVKGGVGSIGGHNGREASLALKYMADGWMSNYHDIVEQVVSVGGDALVINL